MFLLIISCEESIAPMNTNHNNENITQDAIIDDSDL